MAAGKKWTPDDVASLRKMLAAGMRKAEIAQRLERTFSAIETKMRDLNLTTPDYIRASPREPVPSSHKWSPPRSWQRIWDDETRAKVLKAFADGLGREQIGDIIGLKGDAVKMSSRANGVEAEYKAAMKARRKLNTGRNVGSGGEWNESKNAKACAELLRRHMETGIHWLPERLAA